MPQFTVTQFDNRTWLVNDTLTKRVYAECGDPEVGGNCSARAERIARLLNDDTNMSDINARVCAAYLLAQIAKRKAKRRATVKGQR